VAAQVHGVVVRPAVPRARRAARHMKGAAQANVAGGAVERGGELGRAEIHAAKQPALENGEHRRRLDDVL
jgi:hypothetical protein